MSAPASASASASASAAAAASASAAAAVAVAASVLKGVNSSPSSSGSAVCMRSDDALGSCENVDGACVGAAAGVAVGRVPGHKLVFVTPLPFTQGFRVFVTQSPR